MALAVQQSLFEADGGTPMVDSARWIEGVMLGEIALGLCVIVVAFIGSLMLTGRMPLREGMRVVVGSFLLLGAPVIAKGMLGPAVYSSPMHSLDLQAGEQTSPRPELPRISYNPYAQASVRDD